MKSRRGIPGGARTVALAILVLATSVSFALGFFVGRSQAPVKTVIKEVRVPVSRPAPVPAFAPKPEIEVVRAAPKPPVEIKTAPKPPPPKRIKKKTKPPEPVTVNKPVKKAAAPPTSMEHYSVQVGAFVTLVDAERLRKQFEAKGYESYVMRYAEPGQSAVFKVRVGDFIDSDAARLLSVKLKSIEGVSAFVVRND